MSLFSRASNALYAKVQTMTGASRQCAPRKLRLKLDLEANFYMSINIIYPFLLWSLSLSVYAAQPPNSGSEMQQISPAPILQKTAPEVEVEQSNLTGTSKSEQVRIVVESVKLTGVHAFPQFELLALTQFKTKSELTIEDLRGMASTIAAYYHRQGYFVARAYLPAQEIKNGVVQIAVIEGNYGTITLSNKTNLSEKLAKNILSGLGSGDVIASAPLENRLLLLSDLPGVKIKSTLAPGVSVGSSDLVVNITSEQRVTGSVDADNAGNRYTGASRMGATVNLNDPSGQGDVASIRAISSGPGLGYERAAYQLQIGKVKMGVAYSNLDYSLGQEFESLQAVGSANITSLYGSYPIVRSRNNNFNIQLDYDAKTFQDKMNSTSTVTDKRAGVMMSSFIGDFRDSAGGGGLSTYSLTWVAGKIDIQTPAMQALDAETVQSDGGYNKLGITVMRLQSVTDSISIYTQVIGQFASKNLDVSEKMELGGMNAVRAYPEGEAYADQGYVLNFEIRKLLPKISESLPGQIQLIAFVDTGTVKINKFPWLVEQNFRTLSGAGIGINWMETNNFLLKSYYAKKMGNEAATSSPDTSGRLWLQAVKYF